MNNIKNISIHGLGLLILGVGLLRASPPQPQNVEHPHDMKRITVRKDVILDLRMPYSKILSGESPHIYLGIKNGGDKPLNIDADFGFETWNQLLNEARGTDSEDNLTRPEFIPTWESLEKSVAKKNFGFDILKNGEWQIYAKNGIARSSIRWNYDILPRGTRQIRVSLMTGENEWAFSDWVPLQRLNERKLHDCKTIEILFEGTGRSRMIKQAVIDGETYLFLVNRSNGSRIARVPEGATPRFEVFKKVVEGMTKRTLVIHFDGVNIPPVVHDIVNILTLEGTAETAPHLEVLKDLEKTMAEGSGRPQRQTESRRSMDRNQKSSNKMPHTPTEKTDQQPVSSPWLWTGLIVIFLIVIIFARITLKRN